MVSTLFQNYRTVHATAFPLRFDAAKLRERFPRYAHSIWLFTRSDLKTIVGPSTLFGTATALAIAIENISSYSSWTTAFRPLELLPAVLFWVWINLLPFAIDNQRSSSAIAEDGVNKPWRPMPSGMLNQHEAKAIMFTGYAAALGASSILGASLQSITLIGLGIWYNDLGGADSSPFIRNLINASGYLCFTSGALEVASGMPTFTDWSAAHLKWLPLIGAIVFSTVHIQDLSDQEGDSMRGRKTVPIELGDGAARHIISVLVPFWSWACPNFWSLSISAQLPYLLVGGIIAWRSESKRTVSEDKVTFRLWNLWMVMVYFLPLLASTLERVRSSGLHL